MVSSHIKWENFSTQNQSNGIREEKLESFGVDCNDNFSSWWVNIWSEGVWGISVTISTGGLEIRIGVQREVRTRNTQPLTGRCWTQTMRNQDMVKKESRETVVAFYKNVHKKRSDEKGWERQIRLWSYLKSKKNGSLRRLYRNLCVWGGGNFHYFPSMYCPNL